MFPASTAPHLIHRPIRVDLVNLWHESTLEAKESNALIALLRTRFDLRISEDPEVLFYSRFREHQNLHRTYDCLKFFVTSECDRPRPQQADLSLSFDPDSPVNVRVPNWRFNAHTLQTIFTPFDVEAEAASKTDFCNFVYSNGQAKRRIRFFHRLSRYKPVRSGGRFMNNVGGAVADKCAFQQTHKFSIAFENQSYPGYSTEKIVDAFAARTVPIYFGDPEITRDFNPKSFINGHDFKSLQALADYVREVDQNDALYHQYLAAPAFNDGLARIAAIDARLFSAFKNLIENPPVPRASQSLRNRLLRRFEKWKA